MQKTIVFIRHAKSSWDNIYLPDFERKLNERGKKDAPMMGERLRDRKIMPDAILASAATRTTETAIAIAEKLGFPKHKIEFIEKLYHSSPFTMTEVIEGLDDTVNTVLLIAHNPGITDMVNSLSPAFKVPDMPTCAMVGATMTLEHWALFETTTKQVTFFDYPKNII